MGTMFVNPSGIAGTPNLPMVRPLAGLPQTATRTATHSVLTDAEAAAINSAKALARRQALGLTARGVASTAGTLATPFMVGGALAALDKRFIDRDAGTQGVVKSNTFTTPKGYSTDTRGISNTNQFTGNPVENITFRPPALAGKVAVSSAAPVVTTDNANAITPSGYPETRTALPVVAPKDDGIFATAPGGLTMIGDPHIQLGGRTKNMDYLNSLVKGNSALPNMGRRANGTLNENAYNAEVDAATRNNAIEKNYQDNKSIAQRYADLSSGNTSWDIPEGQRMALAAGGFNAQEKRVADDKTLRGHQITADTQLKAALAERPGDIELKKAQIARLQQQGKTDEARIKVQELSALMRGQQQASESDYHDPARVTNNINYIKQLRDALPMAATPAEKTQILSRIEQLEKDNLFHMKKPNKPARVYGNGALQSQPTESGDIG